MTGTRISDMDIMTVLPADAIIPVISPSTDPTKNYRYNIGTSGAGAGSLAIGLFTAAATLTIATGTDLVLTSGYSVAGKGPAFYIYDAAVDAAYVTAHPKASFRTVNGRGFRLAPEQDLNVNMFGAVGNDSTDDLPAFNAALAYSKKLSPCIGGNYNPGPPINIPDAYYYLSSTWQIHHPVWIRSSGSTQPTNVGAILRFGNNCNGIVFHEYRTLDNDGGNAAAASGLGGTSGAILQGIGLWGGNAGSVASGPYAQGDSPIGHGVRIRDVGVVLKDVFIAFFGEDGVNIDATAGTTGRTAGNANEFFLERVWCSYNGRYGCLINGSDSNAGTINTCSFVSNAAGGLMDYSFLGCTHIMVHTRDNCVVDPIGLNAATAACLHSGTAYYVMAGQHVAASTTTPGTNSAVWRPFSAAGTPKTWVTGMTWAEGGPFQTNAANVNSRSMFLACYEELGQPASQATYPVMFWGGSVYSIVGSGTIGQSNSTGGITTNGAYINNGSAHVVQWGSADGNLLRTFTHSGSSWTDSITSNQIVRQIANSLIIGTTGLNGDTSTYGPYHTYHMRLFVGDSSNNASAGILMGGTPSAAQLLTDLSGTTVQRGWSWRFNSPVVGGREGVACLTTGTVGGTAVFAEFGAFPIAGSATWDPASVANGAKTSTTVTATGAALGDFAQASFSLDLAGLAISAAVTSANTVTVTLINNSGGAVDLGSGTVRVRVVKP